MNQTKTVLDFKQDVLREIGQVSMFPSCPQCYGQIAILNSHKCRDGWEMYFNHHEIAYETRVKMAADKLKRVMNRPIPMPLVGY